MPLYTFVMEYNGGTYVSQINSILLQRACIEWAKNLETSEIYSFGQRDKEMLIEQIRSKKPVLLKGMTNAWYVSALIRGNLASINVVQTETADNRVLSTDN